MIATAIIAPDRTLAFLFPGTALPLFLFSFYEGDLRRAFLFFLHGVNQPLLFPCRSTPLAFLLGSATASTTFPRTGMKKVQTFCHGDGGRQVPPNVGPDLLLYVGSQAGEECQKGFFLRHPQKSVLQLTEMLHVHTYSASLTKIPQ